MGAAAEVREGAAETLFRASQVLGAKLPNDQRPTMRILGICRWGWGTGSVGSEPPERCLRPAQGSKTIDPSGAIIAICSVPVRARKSPCDTPRYWARYWAQVIAKRGKTYTGVSVRDGARRRLVFSARIGTPETVGIIRFLGFLLFHSVFRFLPDSLRMLLSLASVFESSRIASLACTGRHPGKSLIAMLRLIGASLWSQ